MALALGAGAAPAADRGTVRWTTPDTSLRPLEARFADPLPLLYLYRQDGADALIRLVDEPAGLTVSAAAAPDRGRIVDLAALPGPGGPDGDGLVLLEATRTGADPTGALRLLDPAAALPAGTEPLRGRPLGLLGIGRAGAPGLVAVSLDGEGRLLLTRLPAAADAPPVTTAVAAPPAPWAAVALPGGDRSGRDRSGGDPPAGSLAPGDTPAGDRRADLALFGVEADGRIVARLVDTDTGAAGAALSFGRRLTPVDAIALPDLYPDGSPELAVLGETDEGRVVGVLIKETGSGATVGRLRLSPSYQPLAMHYLPAGAAGRGELLVVGLRANGALGLQRRALGARQGDAGRGGAGPTLPLKARYVPTDSALLRLGEDGPFVLALAGADWRGRFRIEVRDAVSGDLLLDRALP